MTRRHHARRAAATAISSGLVAAMLAGAAHAAPGPLLPTGKRITLPPIGPNTNVGSLPQNLVATPDGKYAVSSDMGFREKLSAIRTADGTLTGSITLGDPTLGTNPDGLYYGLVFAPTVGADGSYTLYASRGAAVNTDGTQPGVGVYSLSAQGVLTHMRDITLTHGEFPAGLALDATGQYLYVADNEYYALMGNASDVLANVTTPGKVSVYNAATGARVTQVTLPTATIPGTTISLPGSSFPLSLAVANGQLYATSQRDGVVNVLSLVSPAAPAFTTAIVTDPTGTRPTEAHPLGITVNKAGTTVYVANAHADTISVISTATNAVTATIPLRPAQAPDLPGVTPLGLTLSPDERTLYVALADMNAVGVVSLATRTVTGYIPAGWYPTAVVLAPYRRLLVSNAKGVVTQYPDPGYQQFQFNSDPQYDLNQIEGTVELLPQPTALQLGGFTQQVIANNRLAPDTDNPANPLAPIDRAHGGITHVIYIIKENRTYDQVLGDLPQGNGDAAITLFGKAVTPNLHAIASRFVLLDNYYACAEASGDGWPWSTQSLATEYVIKNLPYNYSDRGRNYDFEGQVDAYPVAGVPAGNVDPHGNHLVAPGTPFANGAPPIPDVSEAPGRTGATGGHIWDLAEAAGLTVRNYGFFMDSGNGTFTYPTNPNGTPTFTYTFTPGLIPENFPAATGLFPASSLDAANGVSTISLSGAAQTNVPLTGVGQLGGSDVDFRKYDNAYPDSDAPYNFYNATGNTAFLYPKTVFGHYNAPSRFSEWNREFQILLAKGQAAGQDDKFLPSLMLVRFHHDHTQGMSGGVHTPMAEVADNDYAVGQLIQAVSADPQVWDHTAVFVVEDDSQDGPDHVDVHRSTGYVISPYIKPGSVDHTFYNTDSFLKTMEELLDLPPMSEYDAVASPILDFATTPAANGSPFTATPAAQSIFMQITPAATAMAKNDPRRTLVALSDKMDFVDPDSAPAQLLNEIIWKSVKGVGAQMPAPQHHVIPVRAAKGSVKAASARDADD